MSCSEDDDDGVKLYNPLARRLNRQQVFVTLSSSESDGDGDYDKDASFLSPPRKRQRNSRASREATPPTSKQKDQAAQTVDSDDEVEEVHPDDMLTEAERAIQRQRDLQLEREIAERLAKDTLLSRTRAVMDRVKQQQVSNGGVISLDSDDDDDDFQIVAPTKQTPTNAATATSSASQDKGTRVALHVRSNGSRVDEIGVFSNEPMSVLYERFCDLHSLPRSAVHMTLDGEALNPAATPKSCDLDSGDIIDAKVDFSKTNAHKNGTLIRLRLTVEGKRTEVFRIDSASTMYKLHSGFCKKHGIEDPDAVEMTVLGDLIRLHETIESHQLQDNDEITVTLRNLAAPATIELNVRFDANVTKAFRVMPTQRVEVLIAKAAEHLQLAASRVSLVVDGEPMQPQRAFQHYDLEGGEILDVRVRG